MLNGIYWRLRTGSPWADIPERYGPPTTCYNRFVRWRKLGVWDRIFDAVSAAYDGDLQMVELVLDPSAPACAPTSKRGASRKGAAAGDDSHARCMGRSRGGLTTKIHALVDANGLPIALKLTEGQAHDGRSAADMLDGIGAGQILLADRAYDSDALRNLAERGAWANVKPLPPAQNMPAFSPFLYRYRNLVERFFNKLKHFRAVATRFEKHDANYLALVTTASDRRSSAGGGTGSNARNALVRSSELPRSRSNRGVPLNRSFPRNITMIRSAFSASSTRCVAQSTPTCRSRHSSRTWRKSSERLAGSRPTVGSSIKSTSGRCKRARASSTRRRFPPLKERAGEDAEDVSSKRASSVSILVLASARVRPCSAA